MFRNYRGNLNKNGIRLNDTMINVQTQRKFNTYAEDPAAASNAWRMRRSYWRTNDQIDNTNHIISKYESAWTAMHSIVDGDSEHPGLDGLLASIEGISGTAGAGRVALGRELIATSENIVSVINSKYGDDFIFSGADGEDIPFRWENNKLYYRGVDVATPKTDYRTSDFINADGSFNQTKYDEAKAAYEENTFYDFDDALKLSDMAHEATYVDIGLGMKEDEKGNIVTDSAFDSALSGLNMLGYGKDENLALIVRELGTIFSRADPDTGEYKSSSDRDRADHLLNALHDSIRDAQGQHVQLDARAKYLKTNLEQLKTNKNELNEQIMETESMDPAEAITEMTWAQYCYNAALRIGTQILSQSLIDYMQ